MNNQGSKSDVNTVEEKGLPGASPITVPEEVGSASQAGSELSAGAALPVEEADNTRGNGSGAQAPSIPEKRPVSPMKLAANRANAQHSTGPKTPEGKANSAQNAITHGIFAKPHLIGATPETINDMTTLVAGIWEHYQPVGMIEELVAQKIAVEVGRRGRIMRIEQEELARETAFFNTAVDRVVRYSTSTDRALFRAIEELERIQATRKAEESSIASSDPEVGEE